MSHSCERFTTVRHSRECLTTVVRYSCQRLTTVVRHLCERITTFVLILISLFLAIKSKNGLIYVAYLSHCADRGNFLSMCLRTSAKGWRRVRDGFATNAMTWRRFCDEFCRTKKSIICLKLWRTVRDEFAMHARTLRYHANVSRRFGESIRKPIANSSHPSEIGA